MFLQTPVRKHGCVFLPRQSPPEYLKSSLNVGMLHPSPSLLPPCSGHESLGIASIGRFVTLLVSNGFAQGNLLLQGRHFLVYLAELSPLIAISGGPPPVLSADLWKEIVALPDPVIPEEAL